MSQTEKLRKQILSQNPTDEQKEAIFTEELEFFLRASPGSGKTWTACRRFIWRGANWHYKVGGLALLSFTNTAVREFHDATIKIDRRKMLSDPNYVGTFDSFVERFIIIPFGHLFSNLSKRPKLHIAPRPGDLSNNKLKAWSELNSGKKIPVPAWEIIPFRENREVAYKATKKCGGKTLKFETHNPVEEFLKLGMYTHSQRVYLAWRILKDRPHITECISRRFPEIIVDEAQDTNIWLLILLNLLKSKGTKITLVGDPDQCIYEFSMAHATSLEKLKKHWGLPEKPLSQSFRCNNAIAASVRNISGNISFVGCGQNENLNHRPFVMREPSTGSNQLISAFQNLLRQAGIQQSNSAIICRGHQEIESIRGDVNYSSLKGRTKEMAIAAFYRDIQRDYNKAHQIVEKEIRAIVQEPGFWEILDEEPDSKTSRRIRLALWKFVKSSNGLPPLSKNGVDWIEALKENLSKLLNDMGIVNIPKIGQIIKRTGLKSNKLELPLFAPQTFFPPIRQETIHQVKGESIDGVLVMGSAKFFNAAVEAIESDKNTEERRLAYVALTRARKVLLVCLPASHYDKHISSWERWGFTILESMS